MDRITKLKEALKLSLAFALVYGIALKVDWLIPSWAGWSVVAIAASSGGQSIQKGLMRLLGTLLACLSGITIIAVSPQNRWGFVLLTATVLFIYAYMMLADKKRTYFWFITAYVTLVITAVGPSPIGAFEISIYRTLETAMGIVVYALICIFIWPRSNAGAIKKAASAMINTQVSLLQNASEMMTGKVSKDKLHALRQQEMKQMEQLSQSLKDEGAESYEVKEIRPLWDQFEKLNLSLLKTKDRLFAGIESLQNADIPQFLPGLDIFFKEINNRFSEADRLLSGNLPSIHLQDVKASVNREAATALSRMDKSALAIIINELNAIEADSRTMVSLSMNIAGFEGEEQKVSVKEIKNQQTSKFGFHVFDIENLKGALNVALTIIFGFIIWFFIDPPGHSAWYVLGGIFALLFAPAPQTKTIKLIFPFLIAILLSSLIYMFILPELTNIFQLGMVLFICMFLIRYFLSPAVALVFTISAIQLISVNNPQTFNASTFLNSSIFIPMLMVYLFSISYFISSPRPEKKFLKLVKRFLKSASYLISKHDFDSKASSSFIDRYLTTFYLHELQTLPGKINTWGKAIDQKLFTNTEYKHIEELVNILKEFVVRIEALMDAKDNCIQSNQVEIFKEAIAAWEQGIEKTFEHWDIPNEELQIINSENIRKKISNFEKKIKNMVSVGVDKLNDEEGIRFYNLLGSFQGVTAAALSLVNASDKIDWREMKEERFQ